LDAYTQEKSGSAKHAVHYRAGHAEETAPTAQLRCLTASYSCAYRRNAIASDQAAAAAVPFCSVKRAPIALLKSKFDQLRLPKIFLGGDDFQI